MITTGQYFGEGSDLSNISTLFLVYPFSFKGKLIQYLGKVQHLERNTYYRQIAKQTSLFDDPAEITHQKLIILIQNELPNNQKVY